MPIGKCKRGQSERGGMNENGRHQPIGHNELAHCIIRITKVVPASNAFNCLRQRILGPGALLLLFERHVSCSRKRC